MRCCSSTLRAVLTLPRIGGKIAEFYRRRYERLSVKGLLDGNGMVKKENGKKAMVIVSMVNLYFLLSSLDVIRCLS